MIFSRHTMAFFAAAAACLGNLEGADSSDDSGAASSSNGASSAFGSTPASGSSSGSSGSGSAPASGGAGTPSGAPPGNGTPGGSSPSFRTNPSATPSTTPDFAPPTSGIPSSGAPPPAIPSDTGSSTAPLFPPQRTGQGGINPGGSAIPFSAGINATPPAGAASSFGGLGAGGLPAQSAPATFTIPGGYGQAPIRLTVGEGRLARPRFRYTSTASVGYDDNVLTSPTRGLSVPKRTLTEVVNPGAPAHTEQVQVQQVDGTIVTEAVEVPAIAPTTTSVKIPGVDAPKRVGSLIARAILGWDVQFATRRTVFTFDLNGGEDYYFNRPGSKTDYNANLSLAYLHKFTPRLQVTANVSAAYQTQPNLAQVNTSTNSNVGPYVTLNAKGDAAYRLLPRFSTVTSISYNTVYYASAAQKANTFDSTTFGTELRYLFSPRITLVGELRYSSVSYTQDTTRDSRSDFFLIGSDFLLSRRFTATVRLGEQVRTFVDSGTTKSSPYLELTGSYSLSRATTISTNIHYGFEEPPDVSTTVVTLRGGVSLSHAFTPRLSGVLSLNLVDQVSTNDLSNARSTQDTVEGNIGLNYTLSRQWSFGLNYTYTTLLSSDHVSDYYRNRIFLSGNYTF